MNKIPNKLDHIRSILENTNKVSHQLEHEIEMYLDELSLLGVCFNSLYQAATCHRKCWGGNHVFEALVARSYNLGCASFTLMSAGLYDEALNLVRGLGEISNLIMLSVISPKRIQEWVNADKSTRLRDFSPAKVRRMLGDEVLMDSECYSHLCESFTHITPSTKPNLHTSGESGYCGGTFQSEGVEKCLGYLLETLGPISIMVCKYFEFEDLFGEINELMDVIKIKTEE